MKWWERLQNQCPKCKKYLAFYLIKEGWKYYYFECKFCGFKKRKLILFADYLMKNGKTYLKTESWKDYKEVELYQGKKFWRVREIRQPKLIKERPPIQKKE